MIHRSSALLKRAAPSLFAACLLPLLPPSANAQADTFTQLGTWSCTIPAYGHANCPSITFPEQFGAVPNIVVMGCWIYKGIGGGTGCFGDGSNTWSIQPGNLTPRGFTPTTPMGGGARGITALFGQWIAVGPVLHTGTVIPKYIVLTVVYAPPGTNGGHATSSVSYAAGSTTGVTTSASQSFKVANSLSFEGSGGFLGNGGGVGASFDWSHSVTDTQSLEIKKSTTSTISRTGPSQDGVNHDEDGIYLLLNPKVDLNVSSSSGQWMFADNSQSPIQYVYVGWLNGHQTMPAGVATALHSAGITEQDYPDILARDPLANGSGQLDPARFVPLNITFPYEPPLTATDPVPTVTTNITDASTQTVGTAVEDTYKVGLTISTSGDYLEFAKATLKDTASWEWTNKSSTSTATGTSQSATVTVGGPSFGYSGTTVIEVFTDTIYHTFAFALVPANLEEVGLKGTLVDNTGKPLGITEVSLAANGITRRTFTNARGEYVFFGPITGPAAIEAVGMKQVIPQSTSPRNVELRKP